MSLINLSAAGAQACVKLAEATDTTRCRGPTNVSLRPLSKPQTRAFRD